MENILEKRRIKVEKNPDENLQPFIQYSYSLQNLIIKNVSRF